MMLRKWRIGLAFLALIIVAAILVRSAREKARNSDALYLSAHMVVDYLEANSGKWPKNWDALQDNYLGCVNPRRPGQPAPFDRTQARVVIDWNADPQQLLADSLGSDVAPFRVIRLRDETAPHWEAVKPNQIVLDYLRRARR
jgi:hypothetical protein